ncbi:ABC transporter permease [Pararcticibacter amylolyticus]|uniref:ABC transporter permease n=1 Tax=Pararcticibacter amylolyticus TaxID=2173175 RepID=A0A2U2PBJ6_9SPHI|nr:FtsX-like permease family protein [Pararcticibacter amylolyticus]PWG78771.1 ABC transporter permease [Pararcticibacter amylolyticus]
MLKNYFKIALAVLRRRKFFTFISLFGISFTLTIIIVIAAFWENITSAGYPDTNRDRSLYINFVMQENPKQNGMMKGPASFYYMDHYVRSMKTPEKVAISSIFTATNTYVRNKKLLINMKFTNDQWWDVLEFKFLEGKPYTLQQIRSGERIAVISEDTRNQYFGENEKCVGRYIETDNIQYRVAGVVKSVPITAPLIYADMYLPYTLSKNDYRDKSINGMYSAILLAHNSDELDKIRSEYQQVVLKVPPQNKDYTKISSHADSYIESFTRMFSRKSDSSGLAIVITGAVIVILLLMLLPTINLMNINISRIMERSSEIGVRKAFGASSGTLAVQFIIENIILTLGGGIIGLIFSFLILSAVNNSALIPNLTLTINFTVLLYAIIACLIFGFLSGVYPAWRMSRMEVVNALKVR